MNSLFYPKLAIVNIKKNSKFYFPYLLTCILTSGMFYIMCMIAGSEGINSMPGAYAVSFILVFGTIVIGIFSTIFLFYTNSFLMKRRKKEIGLYNILGMEKRHISTILLYETLITGTGTVAAGLITGILFSKLIFLLLYKIIQFKIPLNFYISGFSIAVTCLLFFGIFFLALLFNLWQIKLTNPIDLLKGGSMGEREPKSKLGIALVGAITLGAGYYIAITTESPLKAITLFFVAVLLVIVGTYCLFTSGSIVLLKLLRKNKGYYYKTKNFTSVSGMIYRMKQNAVGLANICILSAAVLLMVSTTVALYVSMDEQLETRYPSDISLEFFDFKDGIRSKALEVVNNVANKQGRKISDMKYYDSLSVMAVLEGNEFVTGNEDFDSVSEYFVLTFITDEDYSRLTGENLSLSENEVIANGDSGRINGSFEIFGEEYNIIDYADTFPTEKMGYLDADLYYFVINRNELINISERQSQYGNTLQGIKYSVSFDIDGTKDEKIAFADVIFDELTGMRYKPDISSDNNVEETDNPNYRFYVESKQRVEDEIYAMDGGFLFLGIFLGFLFLIATVLIIYYKQISEGYDDRERYNIMQKVGMSRKEVKDSIKSQIIKVFFLPLIMAIIHIIAAFKMVTRLLALFNLTNVLLFAKCTAATMVVFAIIYGIVYSLTARVYYKIVK